MNKTPITYRQEKSHLGSMERSFTDQSTLQEDERMALSFMDSHACGARGRTDAPSGAVSTPPLKTTSLTFPVMRVSRPRVSQATAVAW